MAVQEKAGQAGGNPRFKGAGRLWKSGWKSPTAQQELCCVGNFQSSPDVWYQNPNVLPLVPASGFFVGAVVGVSDSSVSGLIASNGDTPNEGWNLRFAPSGPNAVDLIFEMGDGGAFTSVSVTVLLYTEDEEQLLGTDTRYFAVLAGYAPQDTIVNGQLAIAVGDPGSIGTSPNDEAAPAGPYVNSTPFFYAGGGPRGILTPPNCLAGLVGGRAILLDTTIGATLADIADEWASMILDAGRMTPVPDVFGTPGFANEHGYGIRLASPGTAAPDPWLDFIDAEALTLIQDGDPLITSCAPLLLNLNNVLL